MSLEETQKSGASAGEEAARSAIQRWTRLGTQERQGLIWIGVSVSILLIVLIGLNFALNRENPPRTIVLILANGAYYEDFGFAGSPAASTPTLDGLARTGALFPVTYNSMSRSRPSQRSISTGRLFPRVQAMPSAHADGEEATVASLPATLVRHQYLTWTGGRFAERIEDDGEFTHGLAPGDHLVLKNDGGLKKFLKAAAGRDVLLWWSPNLPQPLADPPGETLKRIKVDALVPPDTVLPADRESWIKAKQRTLAMGAWLDDGIAELFLDLDDEDRLGRTLVVFVSDSGKSIDFASEGTPYEAGLRTPLIVWESDSADEPKSHSALVSSTDIAPTILDWANIPIPDSMEGESLWPLIKGDAASGETEIIGAVTLPPPNRGSESEVYALYVRTHRWKYIAYLRDLNRTQARRAGYLTEKGRDRFRSAGEEELYDLDSDPYELQNLASLPEHGAELQRLRKLAFEWWRKSGQGASLGAAADGDTGDEASEKPANRRRKQPSGKKVGIEK